MSHTRSIETLNSFLRGEMTAVETYRQALGRLENRDTERELRACLASHERRVEALRRHVRALGGAPADHSGPWGAFARISDGDEGVTDDGEAIAVLEEGEDQGLQQYLEEVGKLDRATRRQIEREILPEQVWTHDSLSGLKLTLEQA
jgi:hypothetical protein